MSTQDLWAQWLFDWRSGNTSEQRQAALDYLYVVRDGILRHADLQENDVLLDVGGGYGLVGFGALEQVRSCHVVFCDIPPNLLDRVRRLATEMGVVEQCRFFPASADDLSALTDEFVDVVAARSALIYVEDKQQTFNEFYRVLKPGGRLSLFEPINRFTYPEPANLFRGYDVTPVMEVAAKLKAFYYERQPLDTNPMLTFDERDLLVFAELSGFQEIHLELHANITAPPIFETWETFLYTPDNLKAPPLSDAIRQVLSLAEGEQFAAHIQPLVEHRQGIRRLAIAYLWAVKA